MGTVINKSLVLNYGWIYCLKLNKGIFGHKLLQEEYTEEGMYVGFLSEVYSKRYTNREYTYSHNVLVLPEYSGTNGAKTPLFCYVSMEAVSSQTLPGNDLSIRWQI